MVAWIADILHIHIHTYIHIKWTIYPRSTEVTYDQKRDYLLIFIMRPTNGWDDLASTAPVSTINQTNQVTAMSVG